MKKQLKVLIVGLGYIGLPTAALLGSKRLNDVDSYDSITVVGVDTNKDIVDTINQGRIHIVEPDLDILVKESVESGKLCAKTNPEHADVFIIAVPTPFIDEFKPDLSYIKKAIKSISPYLDKGNIVILESTSPVGTTEKIIKWMQQDRSDLTFPNYGVDKNSVDIAVAHCPERVMPGNILRELVENSRIIGGISNQCSKKVRDFYKIFVKSDCIVTDSRTAELTKLVENTSRDVNIAFANELSIICDKLEINVWELIRLANYHPRVNILQPGPGVGGHCIAVDPWFIIDSAPEETKLIHTARLVNDEKRHFVLKKISQAVIKLDIKNSNINICCLGLTFKPNIDDLRESPALFIAKEVCKMGFKNNYLVEPNITLLPTELSNKKSSLVPLNYAIKNSDIVVLLVDHIEFQNINLSILSGKQLIDTRGIWDIS